ncbi:MAG: ABC transporter substrate-binding protein [Phycisphaerales bacterium]|nr:ABC transporter substrate-binding protein [Phycisphaerales bacterium]
MRIVSLIPSGTEMLGAIGAVDMLVGRSHECDFPQGVGSLPAITAQKTRFDPDAGADAAGIDAQVRASLEGGQSLYVLDEQLFADLVPDLVIIQDLCSVCSIDSACVQRLMEQLPNRPQLIELKAQTVEEILDEMLMLGRAVGLEDRAVHAVVDLKQRMDRAQEHINPYIDGPVVGFMEWTDPVFVAGHWTVQLIERAGGQHPMNPTVILPGSGAAVGPQQAQRVAGHSIAVSNQDFAASRPEHLIIAPCGLTLEQSRAEAERLYRSCDWFRNLPAVKNNRVVVVDGNQMFNRPGPRVVDAQEFLVGWLNNCEHLIPDDFPWEAWTPAAG